MTITRRPARVLLADMAQGRLTAERLMEATLDRIGEVNGEVNAIVGLREPDDLLAEARESDRADTRGPLHGLPIAVKDLVNVRGLLSTMGTEALRDHVPEADDLIAARMRAAGAILIGKTNTPEFGLGSHTFNPVWGATKNPYDLTRSCGGSSGGAAVALATGMLALADGSDMMGSLRNPAAWNNVYGFRPSFGRVADAPGVGDLFLHQLSTLGPMARSPEDMALLLDVISGQDPRAPLSITSEPVGELQAADLSTARIGWLGDWGGAFPMEEGILALGEAALQVFTELGAEVHTVSPPFPADAMWEAWVTLRNFSVAAKLGPLLDDGASLKETAVWEIEEGRKLSAMEVHAASVVRSDWFRAAADLFETFDALILPSAQIWPFDVTLDYPREIGGQAMDTYHRWMQVVIPISLLGLPSVALPAGFGGNGLPMGIQLWGARGNDARLLGMAAAYHARTRWPEERPAM